MINEDKDTNKEFDDIDKALAGMTRAFAAISRRNRWSAAKWFVAGLVAGVAVGLISLSPGRAHEAPSGWSYPLECCSNHDCYEIAASEISVVAEGYVIKSAREPQVIPFNRARPSPDGRWHRCSVGGDPSAWTLCLFVPEGA